MFKKTLLALTVAATFAGSALTMSAPAEAYWPHHHWGGWHHHYWGGPVFYGPGLYVGPGCHWVRRTWHEGPFWHHRWVRVCD
jgi:hypothetical protein